MTIIKSFLNAVLFAALTLLILLLCYKTLSTPVAIAKESIPSKKNKKDSPPVYPADFKEEVEGIVKDYIMENPEVIISTIENWQKHRIEESQKMMDEKVKEKRNELENSSSSPIMGSKEAKNVVVAFYDYNCGHCKKGDSILRTIISEDKNVKVILRPFPILGDMSIYASRIALAVFRSEPDKFAAVHRGLMEMHHITSESVSRLLAENGIDEETLRKSAEEKEITTAIEHNSRLAHELEVKGAPAYIVNGKMFPGLISAEQFKRAFRGDN